LQTGETLFKTPAPTRTSRPRTREFRADGRLHYQIATIVLPCFDQRVDAIDCSPDETFNRIVTGCR
jgi:hypothetical protein